MEEEADQRTPLETGGILMGYWAESEVVVSDLIGPGPKALHEPESFSPDYDYQDREVEQVFRSSRGGVTYLGDWHSHPGSAARLSRKDKSLLCEIAAHEESRAPRPLMAIIAGGAPWQLKFWAYQRRWLGWLSGARRCAIRLYAGTSQS